MTTTAFKIHTHTHTHTYVLITAPGNLARQVNQFETIYQPLEESQLRRCQSNERQNAAAPMIRRRGQLRHSQRERSRLRLGRSSRV